MSQNEMEWGTVLTVKPVEVENDKNLVNELYAFFVRNELPPSVEVGEYSVTLKLRASIAAPLKLC